jgi:hypothetical protein
VFDHRFTLPAYLEAVALRLIVLGVATPAFSSERQAQEELDGMIARLQTIHDKIMANIVSIKRPAPQEVVFHDVEPGSGESSGPPAVDEYRLGNWAAAPNGTIDASVGAVEEFSAFAAIGHWDSQDLFGLIAAGNQQNEDLLGELFIHFYAKHATRTLARRKEVYADVGLRAAYNTINQLRRLRGLPLLQQVRNLGMSWSLGEVDSALATSAFGKPSTAGQHGELDRISVRISYTCLTLPCRLA